MFIIPDFSVIRTRKGYIEIQSSVCNIMMTFWLWIGLTQTKFSSGIKSTRVETNFVAIFHWMFLKRILKFAFETWLFSAIFPWSLRQCLDSICYWLEKYWKHWLILYHSVYTCKYMPRALFFHPFGSSNITSSIKGKNILDGGEAIKFV